MYSTAMSQSAAEPNPMTVSDIDPEGFRTIESRFGTLKVQTNNPISFPNGLLGMPDRARFALLPYPGEKFKQFSLLQSLEDDNLCFITLPLATENNILATEDLKKACDEVGIALANLSILLIVSVHRGAESVRISVNARAPILIDIPKRQAAQYVLQNDKYLVQHFITS